MQVWHLRHATYLPQKCVHFCAVMCGPSVNAMPLTAPPPQVRSQAEEILGPRAFSLIHLFVL